MQSQLDPVKVHLTCVPTRNLLPGCQNVSAALKRHVAGTLLIIKELQQRFSLSRKKFNSDPDAGSLAEAEAQIDAISAACGLLTRCVEAEQSVNNTGPLSWSEEYESLLMLEGCQATVAQLMHQIKRLKEAAAGNVNSYPCDFAALTARHCRGKDSAVTPLLLYSSGQELKDLVALKLKVKVLRQQIFIQKVIKSIKLVRVTLINWSTLIGKRNFKGTG
ncbi:tubulin epsilon and delta complex protein 2-like [Latimeria chalumnae]|uniref:tubulin epsilon and delta complex protein 2-like n=1 Tax=Latimeria chalumnae TaxID=7897 RepID=UPI00313D37AC